MKKLNEAPILEQTTDEQREHLMLIALWKQTGGQIVKVTADDIRAFNEAFQCQPVMLMHAHVDSIDIGVVTLERARVLAAHQATLTPKTPQ